MQKKINTLSTLDFLWSSCKKWWQTAWIPYSNFFTDKTCIDIGIWKGILPARAKKEFNLTTEIGVEPNETHRIDCKKLNLSTKLYAHIEDLPDMIKTDIVLLHGVICLMGTHWRRELENLFSKVNCEHVHVRHQDGDLFRSGRPNIIENERETNRYNLSSYKDSPVSNDLIDFFNDKRFDLIDKKTLSVQDIIMIFKRQS